MVLLCRDHKSVNEAGVAGSSSRGTFCARFTELVGMSPDTGVRLGACQQESRRASKNRCQGRSGIEKSPSFRRSYHEAQTSLGPTDLGVRRPGCSETTFERDAHLHAVATRCCNRNGVHMAGMPLRK